MKFSVIFSVRNSAGDWAANHMKNDGNVGIHEATVGSSYGHLGLKWNQICISRNSTEKRVTMLELELVFAPIMLDY